MKKFKFSFTGRQAGAIGMTYKITDTYSAKDIHEALSYLWTDYSLISQLKCNVSGKNIEIPESNQIKWVKVRSYKERERNPQTGIYKANNL